MTVHRSLGVELVEALFVARYSTLAPDLLALKGERGAHASEAVARVGATGLPVLLVHVCRTGTGLARAALRQIALVAGLAAHVSAVQQLDEQDSHITNTSDNF